MFDEDLTVFFDTDDFAISCTLGGTAVNGIFTDEPVEVNFVQTTSPAFTYRAADKTATIDMVLVNGSDSYKVKNMQPDGTGLMMLILEKQ